MVSYQLLVDYLTNQDKYLTNIRNKYSVILVPNSDYHVTIFRDQWDNYEIVSGKPYYLFHISSDEQINRCSSYFWVNKKTLQIENISSGFFMYNQPTYNFFSSTRNPCLFYNIEPILDIFQEILDSIKKIE